MQKNSETEILFKNDVINKSQLKGLMALAFQKYGTVKSSIIADRIKNLTFHYATRSGISISIEDLRVPYKKKQLIGKTCYIFKNKTGLHFEIRYKGDPVNPQKYLNF